MNDQEWEKLRKKARTVAVDEFSSEASSIIRLTKEEITSILDEATVEKEKLAELISVVNDASKSNAKKADVIKNITGLVEVAVALIGKLV